MHKNRTYITHLNFENFGMITLASDGEILLGCWFKESKHYMYGIKGEITEKPNLSIFLLTREWLNDYFSGLIPPKYLIPLAPSESQFQSLVRENLLSIPYGKTLSYGEIARSIEVNTGKRQSAQAVGRAVSRNPFSVIVPCHRVVESKNKLIGYDAGVDLKHKLLQLEGNTTFFI